MTVSPAHRQALEDVRYLVNHVLLVRHRAPELETAIATLDALLAASPAADTPPTLLDRAVADRDQRPWRYYKLDREALIRLLDQQADKLAAPAAARDTSPAIQPIPGAYVTDGEAYWCTWCKAEFAGAHPANGCPMTAPPPAEAPPSPALETLVRRLQQASWDSHDRAVAYCEILAYPLGDRPTPGEMPPVEVGDWVTEGDDACAAYCVNAAGSVLYWNGRGNDSVYEIRKANGTIWRRSEPEGAS